MRVLVIRIYLIPVSVDVQISQTDIWPIMCKFTQMYAKYAAKTMVLILDGTICPRSGYPFYIVTY